MPCLIIETDELNKERCTVNLGNESIIGREKSNNVYIDDPRASRQHAKITKEPDGSFLLVDMGSRNGIIVNGEKVSRRKLTDKDRIVIGRTTLIFNAAEASAVPPQPAPAPVAPAATIKMSSEDKTITAEPSKLKSDALEKAIQEAATTRTPDKTAPVSKPLTAPPGGPAATTASKPATGEGPAIEDGPSFIKRALVFLVLLIFFTALMLFAKEMTKRFLFKADVAHQSKNIPSSTPPK